MSQVSNNESKKNWSAWIQEALFTRAADSYFSPLLREVAPELVLSKRYQLARVVKVVRHHENAVTLDIVPPRGWQGFIPGQYVNCEFEINGVRIKRNYSISSSCAYFERTGRVQVTVHRVEGGVVSNFIIDEMRLDTLFSMSDAMGEFGKELDDSYEVRKPLLLLAAGSGITPLASIISSGQIQGRKALLMYSCAKSAEHLFSNYFERLAEQTENFRLHLHCTKEKANDKRMDAQLLERKCREAGFEVDQCEVFICGSNAFTSDMKTALQSMAMTEACIHHESFDSQLKISTSEEAQINFTASGKQFSDSDTASILEQAESIGLNPQNGCRMGICHSCTCKKKSGVVRNLQTGGLSSADEEEIRICVSQAVGEVDIEL